MSQNSFNKKLAVIGGGAAGFFGAIRAARNNPDLNITIFERSREVLSKVRISGGGRCNVTHHCFDPELLSKAYPRGERELRWAFERFDAKNTVRWFEERGVELKTEEDGRMFPVTDDSATIINCLKREALERGIQVRTKTKIERVEPLKNGRFNLHIHNSNPATVDLVLIATGGSNRRKSYAWLEELGHSIEEPVPSLFTFNFRDKIFSDLAGISVPEAEVSITDSPYTHTGPLLITHWGLSGPAVLKASAWAARYLHEQEYRFTIQVNWLHPKTEQEVRKILKKLRQENAKKLVTKQDRFPIPNRLWKRFTGLVQINANTRWANLSNQQIHELAHQLVNGTYQIQGKTTYKEEFVTCGGIPLTEIDFGTMESKKCPGVYFAGEVLDIDAITGGYNFQSAWTTGWIFGENWQ
ncbi:NAD(P)/FAD-dependent oxidoreductase [Halalkalibaculum sp. DA3122]|uniref:NAD(P)/FAD-dependent oxidoreductase n=1 Tax=Halalkalibaculum sp. DA3122 TaxID=3373607 RepID=UPI003753FCBB